MICVICRVTAKQGSKHRWLLDLDSYQDNRLSHNSKRTADFQKYMGMKKLKKAVLTHIASSLTQAKFRSIDQRFGGNDQNKDGIIFMKEFKKAVECVNKQVLGVKYSVFILKIP